MKRNKNRGFTLAETMVVVLLILILAAIVFVGVARYRRGLKQLEFDTFAKEIFISAQNHLTMADNQGLLGVTDYGTSSALNNSLFQDAGKDIYYFVYPETSYSNDPDKPQTVLDLMLPIGAVEENIRVSGSYIVRYQKSSASVLDVFYSSDAEKSGLLGNLGTVLTGADYATLMDEDHYGTANRNARRNYRGVVGWYGGEEGLEVADKLEAPVLQVINAEKLEVIVSNPNASKTYASLQLLVWQKDSPGVHKEFELTGTDAVEGAVADADGNIHFVLDDITTAGKHFAEQFANFTPGADIVIKAVAYSNSKLTNIAESAKQTTNSLFAEAESGEASYTASIAYVRHLENLDGTISAFAPGATATVSAKQISDLSWDSFCEATGMNASKRIEKNSTTASVQWNDYVNIAANSFYPVDPFYELSSYDGQKHSVTGLVINTPGEAGMFAQIDGSAVSNLELIDFSVTATGSADAGALAGTAKGAAVSNVVAYHSRIDEASGLPNYGLDQAVTAASGNAGGLIGSMSGKSSVTGCAAALYVSSSGNAGGLIGSSNGTSLYNSYSGGHTKDGQYGDTFTGQGHWNVSGSAASGGLIGSSTGDKLSSCYATCSAYAPNTAAEGDEPAAVAGGLIGLANGTEIGSCYATGLISEGGKTILGSGSATGSANLYFGAINPEMETGVEDMATSISASKSVYQDFFFPASPAQALPYDSTLVAVYKDVYPMRPSGASADFFAATHYGDWPMPDALVYN